MVINNIAEKVTVGVNGRVAVVEMNRADSLNALDKEMLKILVSKLKEISDSDEIDIVVLTGRGEVSSAGDDVEWMAAPISESDYFSYMDCINELIVTLYSMPKLTISTVSGTAAGLGMSLALATDYIIADQSSKFALNFIEIGLIPEGGSHFFLEKRLGDTRAKQMIWEGKVFNAEESFQLGLIQEIADGDLNACLDARIADWLQRPIQAMIRSKKILAEKNRPQLLKVLELEKFGQVKMRETIDHKEGVLALTEKRLPRFIGR